MKICPCLLRSKEECIPCFKDTQDMLDIEQITNKMNVLSKKHEDSYFKRTDIV